MKHSSIAWFCFLWLAACNSVPEARTGDQSAKGIWGAKVQSAKPAGGGPSADRVSWRDARDRGESSRQSTKDTNYIVGGIESAPDSWKFTVSLLFKKGDIFYHYCGGSLIKDRWILTAAHCNPSKGDLVIVGRHDLRKQGGVVTQVERVILHQFNPITGENDIALVRIGAPGAPALPKVRFGAPPDVGQFVTAVGWGALVDGGETSAVLRQVDVPVRDQSQCRNSYAPTGKSVTDMMVCAGEQSKDSCSGDSGGPLLDGAGLQVGIVSFGVGCGEETHPGVYTRVDRYLEWIRANAI
jgi:secreted trypsin-like serine protease